MNKTYEANNWSAKKIHSCENLALQSFCDYPQFLSLVLLLISNLTNGLRLHQFLVTKSAEANKSVKTDANGAH